MSIEQIVMLGLLAAAAIIDIVLTVVSVFRGKKLKFDEIFYRISSYTKMANLLLGPKTGAAKMSLVLSWLKSDCAESGVDYNEDSWRTLVEYILSADSSAKEEGSEAHESSYVERPERVPEDCKQDQKDQRATYTYARRN